MKEFHTILKEFLPLFGVGIGFLLATLKDFIQNKIQNKSKIKMSLKEGEFNYYVNNIDCHGFLKECECPPEEAAFIKVILVVDIYNYGKGNTAIKDVGIIVQAFKSIKRYYKPEMNIQEKGNTDFSFNLPSNSIVTMNLSLTIEKEEDTEVFFREDLSIQLDDKERLLFTVVSTDIKDKVRKLSIEPLSIFTAY